MIKLNFLFVFYLYPDNLVNHYFSSWSGDILIYIRVQHRDENPNKFIYPSFPVHVILVHVSTRLNTFDRGNRHPGSGHRTSSSSPVAGHVLVTCSYFRRNDTVVTLNGTVDPSNSPSRISRVCPPSRRYSTPAHGFFGFDFLPHGTFDFRDPLEWFGRYPEPCLSVHCGWSLYVYIYMYMLPVVVRKGNDRITIRFSRSIYFFFKFKNKKRF